MEYKIFKRIKFTFDGDHIFCGWLENPMIYLKLSYFYNAYNEIEISIYLRCSSGREEDEVTIRSIDEAEGILRLIEISSGYELINEGNIKMEDKDNDDSAN